MASRENMSVQEKTTWILIAVGLFCVESRSLYQVESQNQAIRQDQIRQLDDLHTQSVQSLENGRRQYLETLSKMNKLANGAANIQRLSQKQLENSLGVDSYAWITPQVFAVSDQSGIPLAIYNYGPYSLTGITIKIVDEGEFDPEIKTPQFDGNRELESSTVDLGKFRTGDELACSGWSDENYKGRRDAYADFLKANKIWDKALGLQRKTPSNK